MITAGKYTRVSAGMGRWDAANDANRETYFNTQSIRKIQVNAMVADWIVRLFK
jgi:hypothetical protein